LIAGAEEFTLMLLDHFHPPLSDQRNWKGFHNEWATYLSADLNRRLPPGWFATTEVDFGVEIDVAALDESGQIKCALETVATSGSDVGTWVPAAPQLTVGLPLITDVVEVQVFHASGGRNLVGAIELISPRNKDRTESQQAFLAKCESLLVAGVGLIIIDIVTDRRANLHRGILDRFDCEVDIGEVGSEGRLYVAAYHPVQRDQTAMLDVWHEPVHVGESLPALPLFLRGGPCVRVDLDGTYRRTCQEQRIPTS
jgi:hypothetical protein